MTTWLRWHHGTVCDPKWRLIAHKAGANVHEVLALWCYILEEASQQTNRGLVPAIDYELASFVTGVTESAIVAIEAAMMGRVMDDQRFLTGWNVRQYVDETNAERQARYRKKSGKAKEKSNDSNALRPLRNGSNALRNAQNRTDTDTDTEQNRKSEQVHSYAHAREEADDLFADEQLESHAEPPVITPADAELAKAPVGLPDRLRAFWTELAMEVGGDMANRCLEAARAQCGRAPTEKQMVQVWQASVRLRATEHPPDQWPSFVEQINQAKRREKDPGYVPPTPGDDAPY